MPTYCRVTDRLIYICTYVPTRSPVPSVPSLSRRISPVREGHTNFQRHRQPSSSFQHHHPPRRHVTSPARRAPTTPLGMSISLRLAVPAACPAPLLLRPRARNAGCPLPAGAAALPTGALRGCASLPLKPQPLGAGAVWPCRRRGSAAVCHVSAYLSPPTMQWVSAAAAAVLFLAKGTGIHKSFVVPLFALQAPSSVISWIKSEYGLWTAFLALLVRLFFFVPGELELPLSTMLLVSVAPYQLMNLRGTQGGVILSLALAAFLAFQHFTRAGGLGRAFDQGSIIATLAIICITVINVILLF